GRSCGRRAAPRWPPRRCRTLRGWRTWSWLIGSPVGRLHPHCTVSFRASSSRFTGAPGNATSPETTAARRMRAPPVRRPTLDEAPPRRHAVVIDAARTPIGKAHPEKGMFRDVRADDLSADLMKALLERTKLAPELVEDVQWGCVKQQDEQGFNIGRM